MKAAEDGFVRSLTEAESRLRAAGLTGAEAFEQVKNALRLGMGEDVDLHPALDGVSLEADGLDRLGLAYERFFPDLFKGRLGQYFTPPGIVELMVGCLGLAPGTTVLDPTCGSGGLLVACSRLGASVRGMDIDPRMVDLASLNLMMTDAPGTVEQTDFFRATPEPVDVVVANPPFSLQMEHTDTPTSSDVLFLELLEQWVRPGGRAAIVVPWTLVANRTRADVRARIDASWRRDALCALPEGTFRPFGGAGGRAAVLWLTRLPAKPRPMDWSKLDDPGYDVKSTYLLRTSLAEVQALVDGTGWTPCEGWTPAAPGSSVAPLSEWVSADRRTRLGALAQWTVELADVDRRTGEVHGRVSDNRGRKARVLPNQVLVSRIRPELGRVAMMPPDEQGVGSAEWIRLDSSHPHYLFHALRSETWRASLPPTTGQTRPRTDVEAVLGTRIPRPSEDVMNEVERLSAWHLRQRRRLLESLNILDAAVAAFLSDQDEEALKTALQSVEPPRREPHEL